MKSFNFPNIFGDTYTKIIDDHQATVSNLMLTLMSAKNELMGDPYFGTNIKKLMFEQNDTILRDIVIDDIYSSILQFVPQLQLKRSDVKIIQTRTDIVVQIKATNLIDYQTDLFSISLLESEE